jgi:phenylalanyl-tRNA synthetase alpha chain
LEGKIQLTGLAEEEEFEKKLAERAKALSVLEHEGEIPKELEQEFLQRKLVEKKIVREKEAKLNENGIRTIGLLGKITNRSYNIQDPVPDLLIGKKHPYIQFLNRIRRKLTELGFVEMESPLITQEFYNFDVLFQPQNHPARSWTDTYQLKQPQKGKLPHEKVVKAVKAMHETGGISASSGWQYSWEQEIASKVMPTAHTTAHSARQLVKGIQVPGKYFSIARCYRPDVVDATHLSELNQMEGFIVGENLNFRNLLGMLKQFAIEFGGTKEVRFEPSYYPFTEPSTQLNVKHPQLGWMELGGAGMFRPEMLENLGIKGQALAWGIGIDRLAMLKLGIKDIRYLFSEDLNWLRKQPMVVVE